MPTISLPVPVLVPLAFTWLGWAVALFGGWLTGAFNEERTHRIPRANRMFASLALVLLAAVFSGVVLADPDSAAALRALAAGMALGMALGLLGDLFMAGLIVSGDNRVLGGMGAFGLGHVVYVGAMLAYAADLNWTDGRWAALIAAWLLAVALWYAVVWRGVAARSVLHGAALPYALLLATTAGVAAGLALTDGAFAVLALGAVLFLLSDLLLAAQLFNGLHFRGIGDAVWLLYSPGQMLIVCTAPLASLLG